MSDLYKEALVDGRKLREIAEEEAKKQLLEKFTPFVKDMISKELKVKSSSIFESTDLKDKAFVVGEQEEDPTNPDPLAAMPPEASPMPTDALNATGAPSTAPMAQDPSSAGMGVTPPSAIDPLSNPPASPDANAPVEPVGTNDLGSTTLDQLGDDGKITVDVNDLFSPDAPEAISTSDEVMAGAAPAGEEAPMPPAEDPLASSPSSAEESISTPEEVPPVASDEEAQALPPVTQEQIIAGINEEAYKIDILCLKESKIKDLEKNYHKQRLFSLLEQVDQLKENGLISGRQSQVLENKLEFLFIKLKEANLANSYKKSTNTREDTENMAKSLKSIAAQLFLEEADAIGKTQTAADSRSKSASKHAMDASGNTVGAKADSEHTVPTKEKETFWDDQDPNGEGLLESCEVGDETVQAATGFGEGEEPEVEFEVSEAELMEAIRQLRKENVKRKVKAIKESMDVEEECDTMEEQAEFGEGSEEDATLSFGADDSDVDGLDAGEPDVAAAEQELQAAFDALGLTDVTVSLGGDSAVGSGDEEIEIVDDEDGLGSEESDVMMHDAGDSEEEIEEMALFESLKRKIEAKKAAKKAAALKESTRVADMKKQLNENNLFTAKTVFLNKILMRENMSRDTTRKVVELLDKARTLSEAKEIYQKILARLNEGKVAASTKLAGSSASRATKPGSTSLNESATRTQQADDSSVDRWQILAGIKKQPQD